MKVDQVVFFCLAACAAGYASSAGTLICTPEDGRVWQTAFDTSSPLTWRWEKSAAAATLTVSNLLMKTRSSETIPREVDAAYGSYSLDYSAGAMPCGEALYDLVLVQKDATDKIVDTQTARIARLPGTFAVETAKRIKRLDYPRLVAYDAGWSKSTAAADHASFTFTPARGDAVTESLAGVGGYFPVNRAAGRLTVDFDGSETVWTADVVPTGRFHLILR